MPQSVPRRSNAGHVGGESVVGLSPLAQRQPDLNGVRPLGRPQSVVHEHASNAVCWAPGERLNHLLEEACIRFATNDAVIGSGIVLSYRDLNRRANQLARHLLARGIKSGDRVAMMFDRSPETYVAMLAVMKVNAAYVPLDAAFPIERVRFILGDADVSAIVSMSSFAKRLSGLQVDKIFLDSERPAIDAQAADPLTGVAPPIEPLCYIIYTSGTTGNPKGVGIGHASICNFVRVAAELYGYAPGDRVYQGMTIAFDFSVEEIWVPLMAGATLVPGPAGTTLMGDELGDFLRERRVTVMACCPTLLATIEQDVPDLRILLVGGEACPQNLVARWYRPGRRILNTYGPTEATVTATMTELRPDKPVTIGVPLPTYSIVILDPHEDKTVPTGELGEIGIAGVGLALGYMNRDDLTMKKFIRDFLHIENNPSGRIYRTGDLGRIDENGEIDYRGRIDTQVKIRGYRIELNEIEAVLLDLPQVAQAAVTTFEPEEGVVEIVAYYALKQGVELPRSEISQALRSKLPVYMVPAFLEQVDAIPMTLSNKADYKRLPKPQLQRFSAAQGYVPPKTDRERMVHAALTGVIRAEHISTEHHFFDDLGANSLLMARVCAAIRKNPGMSNVSMRDIYMHPTIARLAHHLDSSIDGSVATKPEPFHVPSSLSYVTCGALQIGFSAAYLLFGLWIFVAGIQWATASYSMVELYARSVAFGAGMFVALTAVPVAAKWLLIGRFKAQSIPIWSFAYFRFWAVKTLMRTSPAAAFIGTPLYNAYLRLMGARIGRNVILRCQFAPVCTDLVTIGDNTIVRNETSLLGYRAQSNFIHMGPVTIGSNAFVGEGSVLDIDTAMGDNTQLGHASSLQSGQRVPDGKRYHGSPAVETSSDYCPIEGKNGTALRGVLYVSLILATLLLIAVPAVMILIYYVWDLYCPSTLTSLYCQAISSMSTPLLLALSAALLLRRARPRAGGRVCHPAPLHDGAAARRDLPEFRLPLPAAEHHPGRQQLGLLRLAVRRLVIHRDVHALRRLEPEHGLSDRLEHGHRPEARQPASLQYRQRHDGFGRAEDDQHADVGDVVPACRVEDRRQQLSGQRHLLPAEWSHRNQRPVRHQDHGPDRRPGARERRAARLAGLRDSAHGRPRSRHERVVRRADASRPAAPEELVQFRHGLDLPRQPVGGSVCRVRARASRIRELRSFRHLRVLRSQRGAHRRQHGLLHRARARDPGLQATQAAARLDLRSVFLVARKVLEVKRFPDLGHVRRHPVPRHAASRHGHEGRCQAVRLQHWHPGTLADRGRRLRQSERGLCVAGTLARGRRVQVRLHPARQQMLARPGGLSSLRRQHRRRRRARRRFLPDEGRDPGLSYGVVRKSGQAGAPPRGSGRGLRPGRRRRHRPRRVRPANRGRVDLRGEEGIAAQ